MPIPPYRELFNPLLNALRNLGGSASSQEMEDMVGKDLNLLETDLEEIHKGSQTKFSYNLAWARTYLKSYGLLENSSRGVWALTENGASTEKVNPSEVIKFYLQKNGRSTDQGGLNKDGYSENSIPPEMEWQDTVIEVLKSMTPDAFERLCQRLLRESGFIQVEVTGRSGDGGIDGRGVVKIGGILSFHVIFQCKRYRDSVSSSAIRDFRGAMVGRADKGLFITTGTFTRDARAEAQRDGAPPLDLIDGDELVVMLKQLKLGIEVNEIITEEVSVHKDWFEKI
ncbi:MAG: restriction endonuclease [Candidatus Methylumidiphilus sp.]